MPAVPLIGYADPLSARPSEVLSFKVHSFTPSWEAVWGTRGRSRGWAWTLNATIMQLLARRVARLRDTAGNTTRVAVGASR